MDRTDTLLLLCDFRITQKPDGQAIEKIRKVAEKLDGYDDDMLGLLESISDADVLTGIRMIFGKGFGLMSLKNQSGLSVKYMCDDILTDRQDEFEEFLSALAPFSEGFMQFCVNGDQIVRYTAEDGFIEKRETPSYNSWIISTL